MKMIQRNQHVHKSSFQALISFLAAFLSAAAFAAPVLSKPESAALAKAEVKAESKNLELEQLKEKVLAALSRRLEAKDAGRATVMRACLDRFGKASKIPDENKAITLKIIEELIVHEQKSAVLSEAERLSLALAIIQNMTSPVVNITQVGGTCTAAAYEVRIASIFPELYASLLMQVALNGKYRCSDGSMIIFPPDSFSNKQTAYKANLACRIFQVTVANIAWQKNTVRPDKISACLGCLRFHLHDKDEALKDHSVDKQNGEAVFFDDGSKVDCPALTNEKLSLINRLLTGKNEIFLISEKWARLKAQSGTFNYNSAAELKTFLQFVAENKLPGIRFPLLIGVDGGLLESGAFKNAAIAVKPKNTHLAAIVDYDPINGKVELNNTWDHKFDFVGAAALSVDELWRCLPPPRQ